MHTGVVERDVAASGVDATSDIVAHVPVDIAIVESDKVAKDVDTTTFIIDMVAVDVTLVECYRAIDDEDATSLHANVPCGSVAVNVTAIESDGTAVDIDATSISSVRGTTRNVEAIDLDRCIRRRIDPNNTTRCWPGGDNALIV